MDVRVSQEGIVCPSFNCHRRPPTPVFLYLGQACVRCGHRTFHPRRALNKSSYAWQYFPASAETIYRLFACEQTIHLGHRDENFADTQQERNAGLPASCSSFTFFPQVRQCFTVDLLSLTWLPGIPRGEVELLRVRSSLPSVPFPEALRHDLHRRWPTQACFWLEWGSPTAGGPPAILVISREA